jgi:hypothetical protein
MILCITLLANANSEYLLGAFSFHQLNKTHVLLTNYREQYFNAVHSGKETKAPVTSLFEYCQLFYPAITHSILTCVYGQFSTTTAMHKCHKT